MSGYAIYGPVDGAVEVPLWRRLVADARPASVSELHLQVRAHPNAIQHRLDRWVRAGFVSRIEGSPKRYAMTPDCPRTTEPPRVTLDGQATPRPATTMRDRMWSAMRVLATFDLPTMRITAGASRRSAEDYINCLQRAGYLRQLTRGNPSNGTWSTYRLVKNTGRRAPRISHHEDLAGGRRRELVDRNTGARIDISPAATSLRSRSAPAKAGGGEG